MTRPLTSKNRLDKLIQKARVHLYKPILIAEILYRDRISKDVDLSNKESYRKVFDYWSNIICPRLVGRKPVLNWRYLLQLFDDEVLPPSAMQDLAQSNCDNYGIVECYIYSKLRKRFYKITELRAIIAESTPETFKVEEFINQFTHPSLRRSVDKAYEIIVYALFESIVRHLKVLVTLSVDKKYLDILGDFEDFARLVLGLDANHSEISQPARLYRLGTANAADAGLDMWANFGPAIQVKHITLSLKEVGGIMDRIIADQVVIVCKHAEEKVIKSVLAQAGFKERIRGFITERDLIKWYDLCKSAKYKSTLGKDLIDELGRQFEIEFPPSNTEIMEDFFQEREYKTIKLTGEWACDT